MEENKRICKKCLLRDFVKEDYKEHIQIYLKGLSAESKLDDVSYQERLVKCSECDSLNAGICIACGCFVEFRAAINRNHCPHLHPRW